MGVGRGQPRSALLVESDPSMLANLTYMGRESGPVLSATSPGLKLDLEETVGTIEQSVANRLIQGDNLAILYTLLRDDSVKGKVRLVYIDPPFSTGHEFSRRHKTEIAYSDTLQGGPFLEFLRQRMVLIRELMADDASIYVHIDCKMGHYVKVLMDEVFGEKRFINDITRIKCNPKNFERRAYGNFKDMVLFYSKTGKPVWNEAQEAMTPEEIERLFPRVDKDKRRYTTTPLHAPGITRDGPTGRLWKGIPPPKGRHWRYPPDELTRLDDGGLIEWSKNKNPRLRIYADDAERNGKKRQDIWEFKDPPYPAYPTEKNQEMLDMVVRTSSNEGDLVLDAFCGSGTTLVSAHKFKRRWIGIDSSPVALKVARNKLKELMATFEVYAAPANSQL